MQPNNYVQDTELRDLAMEEEHTTDETMARWRLQEPNSGSDTESGSDI